MAIDDCLHEAILQVVGGVGWDDDASEESLGWSESEGNDGRQPMIWGQDTVGTARGESKQRKQRGFHCRVKLEGDCRQRQKFQRSIGHAERCGIC